MPPDPSIKGGLICVQSIAYSNMLATSILIATPGYVTNLGNFVSPTVQKCYDKIFSFWLIHISQKSRMQNTSLDKQKQQTLSLSPRQCCSVLIKITSNNNG